MTELMTAVVIDGRGGVELVEKPVPQPGDGEVIIAPQATGVCGTDLHLIDGTFALSRYPVTPGHEFASLRPARWSCGCDIPWGLMAEGHGLPGGCLAAQLSVLGDCDPVEPACSRARDHRLARGHCPQRRRRNLGSRRVCGRRSYRRAKLDDPGNPE